MKIPFEIFAQGLCQKRLFSDNHELESHLCAEYGTHLGGDGDDKYKVFLCESLETWSSKLPIKSVCPSRLPRRRNG